MMNDISTEQAGFLMNHIRFMMNTGKFDFIIYTLPNIHICDTLSHLPSYTFDINKKYDKFFKFETINQLETYIQKFFKSDADFFNYFNMVQDAQPENNGFLDSLNYLVTEYKDKISYDFEPNFVRIFTDKKHLCLFNFVLKNDTDINIFKENLNTYNHKFYDNDLNEKEKEYFKNIYYADKIFAGSSAIYQFEHTLSKNLVNYRLDFTEFNLVKHDINVFENFIKGFFMNKLHEQDLLKYGENHKFEKALKDMLIKLANNLSNKKIQFQNHSQNPKEIMNIEYNRNRLGRYNDDENIKKLVLNTVPELTEKTISSYYTCSVNMIFVNPLTMQVKKTFMEKLRNYMINNNIKPINYYLDDNNKVSKPAYGIKLVFACNNYENIGINPIKFLIPKMGMSMN